ncbi:two-component system response regulator [Thermococcus chitonophagus]|uniref:Chemotaxis regulator-transmits chemoreceptor signals to flagelllar motor components CheY n=1 Tax=Thermococcus chitonophagus TaxID=54262 RepID=A0A160VUI8_9EURY|nr:response regulator [Thermococcus chitonophagus]ASJ16089.1 two-component system response regulator [Thermococcus chitonophagus]CUX77341.1 Chemotaxis regulator-transmits chemoreceptor signals to flagelllar motor components CheY [Thermococcus chitonophagus]
MARILIVDDAAFMRMLLKKILTQAGHEVVGEASNGKEAVELYKKLKPDLVTMDIVMPEMDGITAVKEIMKIDPNAKIIMITAVGQEAKVMEALKSGAKGYIVKPFQAQKVIEEVNRVLSS